MENSPLRLGILGAANIARGAIIPAARRTDAVEVVAVASRDGGKAGEVRDLAPDAGLFEDYRSLVESDEVEAVYIPLPNSMHVEWTLRAIEAGKHVLCEKPLATTVEDAQAMIDACARRGVKLQTAFPVRFNASVVALRDAIRAGEIGTPLVVSARNPGTCPHSWFVQPELSGGGAVIDHTVHVVDALRWIFDAEVTEVYAEIDTRMHDIPTDDTGLLMFKLSNGVPVSLDTTWSRPEAWPTWGGVTIDVIGETGVFFVDAYNNSLRMATNDTGVTWPNVEVTGDPEMVAAFIDAVANDTDPVVTGEDGLRALQVALCAYESAKKKVAVPVVTGA